MLRDRPRCRGVAALVMLAACAGGACGKRGAPLPPLIELPTPPANLTAERRGNTVTLELTIPRTNTDESQPANVASVQIFAFSGPLSVSDDEVVSRGTRVATVAVRTQQDQGNVARVEDQLTPDASTTAASGGRTYIGVAVTAKGRRGPLSRRAVVPLDPPPLSPSGLSAAYDERALTLQWQPVAESRGTVGYYVYEVESAAASARGAEARLTPTIVADPRYVDSRMTWGTTRCYAVRAVLQMNGLSVESGDRASTCIRLTDTFPPARPKGLQAVAGQGAISLIWDANAEGDLEGYIVLRGTRGLGMLTPVTPTPVRQTTFRDEAQAGVAYLYAVVAVDLAGNRSELSESVEETAR